MKKQIPLIHLPDMIVGVSDEGVKIGDWTVMKQGDGTFIHSYNMIANELDLSIALNDGDTPILFANKKLVDLPVLVMPDETCNLTPTEILSESLKQGLTEASIVIELVQQYWLAGAAWAREKLKANPNKYSEEDLINAMQLVREKDRTDISTLQEEVIASLHPKPIAVMVEMNDVGGEEWGGDAEHGEPFWNSIWKIKTNSQNQIIVTKEDLIYNKL